jgi:hypothetical protein
MVVPGTYRTSPVVSPAERAAGLAFDAAETTVATAPVMDLAFTQSRYCVRGSVHCFESPCGMEVSVTLTAVGDAAAAAAAPVTATFGGSKGDTFAFEQLMPGTYILQVGRSRWGESGKTAGSIKRGSSRSRCPLRCLAIPCVWNKPPAAPSESARVVCGLFTAAGASCARPVVLVAARASGAGRGGRRVRSDAGADGLSDAGAYVARHADGGYTAGSYATAVDVFPFRAPLCP